ncbi:MAG TPA: ABC transporter substrate-binding protein [Candidatus Acidoferrales bacterium]|nr:ABC transporter substrate-binding protein [Candidatus Acidoferrales bacterium]
MVTKRSRRGAPSMRAALVALAVLLCVPFAFAAEKKINVAYSSISGNMAPLWIAHEAGFFRKYGLDTELILIEGGSRAVQTLGAGDAVFAQMAAPGVIQAALRGADAVMIAGVVNTLTFQFYVDKEITEPDRLKGKAVGVTRHGSSTDFAMRFALDKYGLKPESDVAIQQLGTMPALVAALESKKIQGAMLSSPFTLKARKAGFRLLADLQMLGLEYQHTGLVTTRATIKSQPELVRNFIKAYVEGIHYYKTRRNESLAILQKYLKVDDQEALADVYEAIGLTLVPEKPYPTLRGIRTILMELSARDPAAANARPEQFVDMTFIRELDKSGFIDALYKAPAALASAKPAPPAATATKSPPAPEEKAKPPVKASPAPKAQPEPTKVAQAPAPQAKSSAAAGASSPAAAGAQVAAPSSAAGQAYTVQPGDTLSRLAARHYGSPFQWEKIYAANKATIKNPDYIFVGQKIILPPAGN